MTPRLPARARRESTHTAVVAIGAILLALAGFWLLHRLLADTRDGVAPLLAVVAWLAGCGIAASLASTPRWPGLLATMLAVGTAWHFRSALATRVDLIYLLQHAGTHLCLAGWFAATLGARRGPALITRLATRIHGPLPEPIQRYTRQVTLLWTSYFLGMALLSTVLFLTAPLATWSVLANLVTMPVVVAIFVGEYLWRLRRFPDFEHASILDGIRAYRR